ncbi:hypothetical protein [Sphingomonas sp. CLY1604]|uniref:hypothetical protein n=1 Tax=Sphingomonas sp. CLY1604 TaxID=3457786 RepID=UPI003FD6FC28
MNPSSTISVTAFERTLDRIEARGRKHLRLVADHRAAIRVIGIVAPTALACALVLLAIRMTDLMAPLALAGLGLLVPVIVGAVVFALVRRGGQTRVDALALVDARLALKNRAETSDEFLRLAARDGFHEAALLEAQGFIDRAADAPLPGPSGPVRPSRAQWLMLVAAVSIIAIALLPGRVTGGSETSSVRSDAAVGKRSEGTAGDRRSARDVVGADGTRAGGGDAGVGSPAAPVDPSHAEVAGGAKPDAREAGSNQDSQAQQQPGNASAGASPARGEAAASGGSARRDRQERVEAGPGASEADQSASRDGGAAPRDASSGDAAGEQEGERGRQSATDARSSRNMPLPPQPGSAPKGRSGAAAPNVAAAGNEQPQQSQQKPGQQTSNGGRQSGQGSGRSSGKDALKHTRGIGALLLAVPMEDRLIGTVNTGAARSTTRAAQLRGAPDPGAIAAQERGQQEGDSGRIGHQPASLHDKTLVRRYFDRDAGRAR